MTQTPHPSSVTDGIGGPNPNPSTVTYTDTDDGWGVGYPSVPKKPSVRPFKGIKMSAPVMEGAQDDDDILGFPGDGFVDKTDANPGVLGEQDEEGDDARSNDGRVKKRRKSAVVAPDGHVTARIKQLKKKITGSKREDNEWTKMFRSKLDQEKVENRLADESTLFVGSVRHSVR